MAMSMAATVAMSPIMSRIKGGLRMSGGSIKRTRETPLRTWTELSRNFGEEAGDSQYEADDEWRGRPKMSQIRNSMKRRR